MDFYCSFATIHYYSTVGGQLFNTCQLHHTLPMYCNFTAWGKREYFRFSPDRRRGRSFEKGTWIESEEFLYKKKKKKKKSAHYSVEFYRVTKDKSISYLFDCWTILSSMYNHIYSTMDRPHSIWSGMNWICGADWLHKRRVGLHLGAVSVQWVSMYISILGEKRVWIEKESTRKCQAVFHLHPVPTLWTGEQDTT